MKIRERTVVQMVNIIGDGVFAWNGKSYESDVIRACIRPKALAVGKAVPVHLRRKRGEGTAEENPDYYLTCLLLEPNPLMGWQQFAEKMETTLMLNNNAFAVIERNPDGLPVALYPADAASAEAVYDKSGVLSLRLSLMNGKTIQKSYGDIIHLRRDFYGDSIFGNPAAEILNRMGALIACNDKSVAGAIRTSAVIRWLLKTSSALRPEQRKERAREFAEAFLESGNNTTGVAVVDPSMTAEQVENKSYVPDNEIMSASVDRIYKYFNVSPEIVSSSYTENQWAAYYESQVQPDLIQFAGELTRKLFTPMERAHGNRIELKNDCLEYLSVENKLRLSEMVDRGALTPNQWREAFGWKPLPGGDNPLRRLDTAAVRTETGQKEGEIVEN